MACLVGKWENMVFSLHSYHRETKYLLWIGVEIGVGHKVFVALLIGSLTVSKPFISEVLCFGGEPGADKTYYVFNFETC